MSDGSSGSRLLTSFGRPRARNRLRRAFRVTVLEALEGRRLLSSSGDHAAALAAHRLIRPVAVDPEITPLVAGVHHGRAASAALLAQPDARGLAGDPALIGSWTPPTSFRPPHA